MAVPCSCSRSACDVCVAIAPVVSSRRASTRPGSQDADRLVLESFRIGRGQHHVAQPLGQPDRFLLADRDHDQPLDLVEPFEQADGSRHVGHDVQQVGVDVLAALPVTLLRRAARLVEVDVPLRGAGHPGPSAGRGWPRARGRA